MPVAAPAGVPDVEVDSVGAAVITAAGLAAGLAAGIAGNRLSRLASTLLASRIGPPVATWLPASTGVLMSIGFVVPAGVVGRTGVVGGTSGGVAFGATAAEPVSAGGAEVVAAGNAALGSTDWADPRLVAVTEGEMPAIVGIGRWRIRGVPAGRSGLACTRAFAPADSPRLAAFSPEGDSFCGADDGGDDFEEDSEDEPEDESLAVESVSSAQAAPGPAISPSPNPSAAAAVLRNAVRVIDSRAFGSTAVSFGQASDHYHSQ